MKQPIHSIKMQRSRGCKINSIEHKRWAAYATAAVASSVSLANSAEAEIHYSGLINQQVGDNSSFTFPLGNDGVIQVQHFEYFYGSSSIYGGTALLRVYAPSGGVRGVVTPDGEVSDSRLMAKNLISAGPFVATASHENFFLGEACYHRAGGCYLRGQFQERGLGFVGFKFNNGAGDQYGWARVRMRGADGNRFLLVDYAYGDSGETVLAGQRSSNSAPTMDSLGGLALGAAGLLAWRRRRANQRAVE